MRHVLLATLPACFFAFAAPAMAQDVAAATQDETASEGDIVVTARRREETLIEVPGAVSAITAADQQNYVISNTADILRQLPSAALVNGGPAYTNEISLRGQGGGRNGFSESAVGVYRDGHYTAIISPAAALAVADLTPSICLICSASKFCAVLRAHCMAATRSAAL